MKEKGLDKGKYNLSISERNIYSAPIYNMIGEKIIINNIFDGSLKQTTEISATESKYSTIIMYLESLDEKNKHYAIADVKYMLENEYCIDEQIMKDHSEDKDYQKIIGYLDSFDKKTCHHAVVDIEYLLEVKYGVKSKKHLTFTL